MQNSNCWTSLPHPAGKRRERLVVAALAAADERDKRVAHLDQPLIGGGDLRRAVEGAGLALGQVPGGELAVLQQVVLLRILRGVGGEAEGLHLLGKDRRDLSVAVDDKDMLRPGGVEVAHPTDEMVMVGVGGQALEVDDLRADGDLLAEHLHALCPLEQVAAQRPGRLEADEHDAALRTPEVVLEVVADAARVAHAGGGDDDLGRV